MSTQAVHYVPQSSRAHYVNLNEAVALGYGAYQTLRKYIYEGRLPAVKIGGRVKVLRSDLDALAIPKQASSADVENAIERLVASAPPLTDEQVHRLSALLAQKAGV